MGRNGVGKEGQNTRQTRTRTLSTLLPKHSSIVLQYSFNFIVLAKLRLCGLIKKENGEMINFQIMQDIGKGMGVVLLCASEIVLRTPEDDTEEQARFFLRLVEPRWL